MATTADVQGCECGASSEDVDVDQATTTTQVEGDKFGAGTEDADVGNFTAFAKVQKRHRTHCQCANVHQHVAIAKVEGCECAAGT